MAPWGRRPGGGGVGRLRLGGVRGDDRAGTVPGSAWGGRQGGDSPTRTGGDMRGTGRGCGGAGNHRFPQ